MKKLMIALSAMLFVTSCYRAPELPQVTTTIPVISDTAVIVGGEVTSGGNNKTIRGVSWSQSQYGGLINDFMLDASKGVGVYSFDILGQLEPNTQYYVQAFAENKGSARIYGDVLKLTSNCCNPYNAIVNSRGCIECDNYAVGDTFVLNNMLYVVADETMIDTADYRADLTKFCVSKITDMSYILLSKDLFGNDLSSWDVSNVTNMQSMFGLVDFFYDIGNWDVSNVTNMSFMFNNANLFNADIGNWDVSNVTNMNGMFGNATSFNQDIGNWDVSNVTDMSVMFYGATRFNQDIGNWDVSNVTNISAMFYDASAFNQDLTQWCVSNFSSMPTDFSTNSALTASNHPVWGTCP